MKKPTYHVKELAKEWDCSPRTILREISRGHLEAFKVGKNWRVKDRDREAFEQKKVTESD